jgi:hypothetical protein
LLDEVQCRTAQRSGGTDAEYAIDDQVDVVWELLDDATAGLQERRQSVGVCPVRIGQHRVDHRSSSCELCSGIQRVPTVVTGADK